MMARRAADARDRRVIMLLLLLPLRAAGESSVPEPGGYWTGPAAGPVPATIAGGSIIHARQVAALLKRNDVVVVDVDSEPQRPPELAPRAPWLPLPHRGIPGSIWIPGAGLGEIAAPVNVLFRRRLAEATDNDPRRPVVIYCHARCWLSWNAAKRAISYGYQNVYWFPEGIEGWAAAGLPTVTLEPERPP